MPYKGQLTRNVPFTIEIAAGLFTPTGITIVKINQRGGMHASVATIPVGQAFAINESLGSRIVRMIVHVHPPEGSQVNVSLVQGVYNYADFVLTDAELVWDAVP